MSGNFRVMSRDTPIQGQGWFCISYVGPTNPRQKSKQFMFKVRYVADTEEEARAFAGSLHAKDPDFDVFIAPVGTWLPFTDNPLDADKTIYDDAFLETLIDEHKTKQKESAKLFADRVRSEKHYIKNPSSTEEENVDLDDAIRMRYDIYKLDCHIQARTKDLAHMREEYQSYAPAVRASADSVDLPKIDL